MKGIKYIALRHNLVRGGAGCSILKPELPLAQKYIQRWDNGNRKNATAEADLPRRP